MERITDPLLYQMLSDYLSTYLPHQRNASQHTITAEKTSLNKFMDYLCRTYNCNFFNITLEMFNCDNVKGFLGDLVQNQGRKASTRNQRLACIKSFINYLATRKPEFVIKKMELSTIPIMHSHESDIVKSISEKGVKAILFEPNPLVKVELRDQFMMILLYDSGARASELLNLKISDVILDKTPKLKIFGKGSKTRIIPLMDETVAHYENYLHAFHFGKSKKSNDLLFFTVHAGEHRKMSLDNLSRCINKYAIAAHQKCSDVPDSVHPHMFRHSRAVILYHNGMPLPEISRFLGHANIETTIRFYARLGVEDIRQVMIKANAGKMSKELLAQPYTINDEDTLKRLIGLK